MNPIERVSAAIERAKARYASACRCPCGRSECATDQGMTELEITLAEQLWKTEQFVWKLQGNEQPPPPALITFCEEAEQLD